MEQESDPVEEELEEVGVGVEEVESEHDEVGGQPYTVETVEEDLDEEVERYVYEVQTVEDVPCPYPTLPPPLVIVEPAVRSLRVLQSVKIPTTHREEGS